MSKLEVMIAKEVKDPFWTKLELYYVQRVEWMILIWSYDPQFRSYSFIPRSESCRLLKTPQVPAEESQELVGSHANPVYAATHVFGVTPLFSR